MNILQVGASAPAAASAPASAYAPAAASAPASARAAQAAAVELQRSNAQNWQTQRPEYWEKYEVQQQEPYRFPSAACAPVAFAPAAFAPAASAPAAFRSYAGAAQQAWVTMPPSEPHRSPSAAFAPGAAQQAWVTRPPSQCNTREPSPVRH